MGDAFKGLDNIRKETIANDRKKETIKLNKKERIGDPVGYYDEGILPSQAERDAEDRITREKEEEAKRLTPERIKEQNIEYAKHLEERKKFDEARDKAREQFNYIPYEISFNIENPEVFLNEEEYVEYRNARSTNDLQGVESCVKKGLVRALFEVGINKVLFGPDSESPHHILLYDVHKNPLGRNFNVVIKSMKGFGMLGADILIAQALNPGAYEGDKMAQFLLDNNVMDIKTSCFASSKSG